MRKIIGFAQLKDELQKGNLLNWFKCMDICDKIYIYDQHSIDGSIDEYKKRDNVRVIYSPTNRFREEIKCKAELLELLLLENSDVDWIFWLDGDTCLDNRLVVNNFTLFHTLLEHAESLGAGAIQLGHYNLWRSDDYYRVDNRYHELDNGVICLWRNNGNLFFPSQEGLHHSQYPRGISNLCDATYLKLVHRGFVTEDQIRTRYNQYRAFNQSGPLSDRLISEETLEVKPVEKGILPTYLENARKGDPTTLPPLKQRGIMSKKDVEVIAMVYKSTAYLDFIVQQLRSSRCQVKGWDVGIRVVANDPSPNIIERLQELNVPYSIYHHPNIDEYYLNRVYACWNWCVQTSKYSNVCLVNSDMMFTSKWLTNLLKYHNGTHIPCSRLVESGKMPSGKFGISKNFGTSVKSLKRREFQRFAKESSVPICKEGGLFMPVVFNRERFIDSGGYPQGNIYEGGIGAVHTPFLRSGDAFFFQKVLEERFGMKHVTAFDSIVYHIQEGEMDAS